MKEKGFIFLFLLGNVLCLGVFDGGDPFVKSDDEKVEVVNASSLSSRDVVEVEGSTTTESNDLTTVSALPLEKNDQNAGVVLRMDSELHLSRFVSKMRGGQCGTTITDLKVGAKGFITSPNYPSDYPPDEKCTWWLKAKDNGRIQMSCSCVMTQSCDGGYYDYILVSPDWTWEKYYLLCGDYNKFTPFTLTSKSNYLSVYFRSSLVQHYRGFQCNYEVISDIESLPTTQTPEETTEASHTYAVMFNGEPTR